MPLRTLDETTLQADRPVPVKRKPGAAKDYGEGMAWIPAFGGPFKQTALEKPENQYMLIKCPLSVR